MSNRTFKMVYLHALTPVHSGTGQTVAVIDLPIAREKATGWPVIPASSMKGVVRDMLERRLGEAEVRAEFGSTDQVGAVCFGDQRILFLPVRSMIGTFAYVTCPLAIHRYNRDRAALELPAVPSVSEGGKVANGSKLVGAGGATAYLEDLDLPVTATDAATAFAETVGLDLFADAAERKLFVEHVMIVSDDHFNFLSETTTEVAARIRLNDDGTTTGGGGNLWYEEAVPAEAIFAGPLIIEPRPGADPAKVVDGIKDGILQVGGKASVGRGICRVRVSQ